MRDPQHATVAALQDLPHGSSSKLVVVKIDSKKLDDASIAVDTLKAQGIHALDVVIANAGLSAIFPTVAELNPAHLVEHHLVNVVGPLMLFQAVRPLLLASKNGNAKFVAMGSQAGVQTNMPVIFDLFPRGGNNAAYGPSKTALNFLMQEAHHENKDLTVFVVDPGFVRTEMGNSAADMFGISLERGDFSSVSVEETTTGLVKIVSMPSLGWRRILADHDPRLMRPREKPLEANFEATTALHFLGSSDALRMPSHPNSNPSSIHTLHA